MDSTIEKRLDEIVTQFLSHRLSPQAFEKQYMALWREVRDTEDYGRANRKNGGLYDHIFTSLDCYCAEPELRDESDFDEEQLYEEVERLMRGKWAVKRER